MDRFQPAIEAHIDAIVAMMRDYYAEDDYHFNEGDARAALLQLIRRDAAGRLWTAHVDGNTVGYLAVTLGFSLEYRGRDAFLDELYVSEPYRGRGLGREALRIAEQYCRDAGVKALHLEVERHRESARILYERHGFAEHNRTLLTKLLNDSR